MRVALAVNLTTSIENSSQARSGAIDVRNSKKGATAKIKKHTRKQRLTVVVQVGISFMFRSFASEK
jgi:hypothetical protein